MNAKKEVGTKLCQEVDMCHTRIQIARKFPARR